MNERWWFGTALFAAAAVAMASQPPAFTISPRGAIYQDDLIVLTARLPAGVQRGALNLRSANARVVESDWNDDLAGERQIVVTFTIVPESAGPLVIEGDYTPPNEATIEIQPITLEIQPDLARASEDLGEVFKRQRAAKRIPIVFRAAAGKQRAYAGERVEVRWIATIVDPTLADSGMYYETDFRPIDVRIGEVSYNSLRVGRETTLSAAGGEFVRHNKLHAVAVTAVKPGVIDIPAQLLRGRVVRRYSDGREETERFVRWSNPVRIEVLPAPAAARNLPIGQFQLQCHGVAGYAPWPQASVNVSGSGDLAGAEPPELVVPSTEPIIISDSHTLPGERTWTFEVRSSAERVKLPRLQFSHFDPASGLVKSVSCAPVELPYNRRFLRAAASPQTQPPRRQQRAEVDERMAIMARGVGQALALFGAILVYLALRK